MVLKSFSTPKQTIKVPGTSSATASSNSTSMHDSRSLGRFFTIVELLIKIGANVNSLRRQRSLFLMHVKSSTCARLKTFSGLASMKYQYLTISQTISTES